MDHAEVARDERLEGDARVPENARLATLPKLAFTWSGVLMSSTPIIAGIVVTQKSPTAGYPMGLFGLLIGLAIGATTVGWLSSWGPRTGLGQMPLNRLAFGRGNVLPEIILVFSLILWSTFNLIFGVAAILEVLHLPFALGMLVVGGTQLVVGLLGYRAFERLGLLVTALMTMVIVALAIGASHETPPMSMLSIQGAATFDGLALGIAFGMGSTFAWNIQATDTSRNLPVTTSPRRVFWTVWLSMFLPLGTLAFLGAWIGTMMAVNEPMQRINEVLGEGPIAAIALMTLGLGLAAENSYNDFSNVIILRSWGLNWNRRVVSALSTITAVGLAAYLHNTPLSVLSENGGIVLGYF
jgi:NCS1 family nucleobase:cation symporter-1